MRKTRGLIAIGCLALLAASGLAGCGASASPLPSICDDIPAWIGGCSSLRPVYTGTSCDDFGKQWGSSVDAAILRIAAEPEVVDGRQRSARVQDAMILATVALGLHLDDQGRLGECGSQDVLASADKSFTDKMRETVPSVLYDNLPPATWDQFESEALKVLKALDEPASS